MSEAGSTKPDDVSALTGIDSRPSGADPSSTALVSSLPPPWWWPRAAYLHVPFCAHRCGYCDFATVAGQDHRADQYLDALDREMASLETPQPVVTIFVGGGTPTHLTARQLARLLHSIRSWFLLEPGYEFTVEVNPGTLDGEKLTLLADHGVNRLSLGGQSFHPHLLRILERHHQPEDLARAIELARRRIAEISVDLIFGIPGQTLEEWRADLETVATLQTPHLSTYGLTYEKGTRLWKQRESGQVVPVAEELELAMYVSAIDTLAALGFEHYEISNFARPGHRCRHNLVYWANEAYFGFGLGAARYVQGRREVNTRDLTQYLRQTAQGVMPIQQAEELVPRARALETAILQLRRMEGIDRWSFRNQTGHDLDQIAAPVLRRRHASGLLEDDGRWIRLSRQGKFLADVVFQELLALE
jgi:oxygen-independent coproporphyrinogen-3 oxidase